MTAKRFTIDNDMDFNDKVGNYELNCIRDNENKTFYFIADSIENVQLFVKRLNELHEENKKLKQVNEMLQMDFAMTERNLIEENEHLKKELKRCKDWLNSDKYDYQLTLAFIKNKGYSLKDVLEYEKELE